MTESLKTEMTESLKTEMTEPLKIEMTESLKTEMTESLKTEMNESLKTAMTESYDLRNSHTNGHNFSGARFILLALNVGTFKLGTFLVQPIYKHYLSGL